LTHVAGNSPLQRSYDSECVQPDASRRDTLFKFRPTVRGLVNKFTHFKIEDNILMSYVYEMLILLIGPLTIHHWTACWKSSAQFSSSCFIY